MESSNFLLKRLREAVISNIFLLSSFIIFRNHRCCNNMDDPLLFNLATVVCFSVWKVFGDGKVEFWRFQRPEYKWTAASKYFILVFDWLR